MELNELKLVTASNIIKLRTGMGLTQAELGARLNYSDKTISKWERGEAIPDAYVLTQLAGLFGVSVDFILSSHDKWEKPKENEVEEVRYSVEHIIAIVVIGVLTAFLIAFVTLWLMGIVEWRLFLFALSAAILAYLVMICVFKRLRQLQYVIALFVASVFTIVYFFLPTANPWQLFLVLVPAEVLVFLACNVKKRRHPHPKKHDEN
ncbi:MAG: helix-turn-helix transcriptional regulator [Oscillospiraceae bacterium]|nr:helix-turn-helix transcriptional regulator [Oscillospiraceae bacterium]